jgi:ribosomal protein S18 acetylase RimI-like enzyme
MTVRLATADDAAVIGRLLHDFNVEFGDPTPAPAVLAARIAQIMATDDTQVLLSERDTAIGVAVLRFRPSLWSPALECYLAELYIVPEVRGTGLGRELLNAATAAARTHGADYMDLGTAETDTVARHLYESAGFSRTEGRPDGPVNFYYEREL